jgi:hypothetical protein
MYRRGPFWGGGYMRRRGFPLFPMGGYGMGMGMGGLLGDLVAGGIGYMMGKQSAQQGQQYQGPPPQYQTPQYQPPQSPQYQTPQYQPPQSPQYQTPQYQPPQSPQYQAPAVTPNQQATASGGSESLAQLKLLGHLRDSGLLTNDEFEVEKRKIMQGY